jgi:NADH dehydrogenase [ubiquinone] 1 alpha subcomplex assembly factor 5
MFKCTGLRRLGIRTYATGGNSATVKVFDRSVKLLQKERAAHNPDSKHVEYLRDEINRRTIDRLAFVKTEFTNVLDFGAHSGNFERLLCDPRRDEQDPQWKADRELIKSKIGKIVLVESSESMLYKDLESAFNKELNIERVVADEENFDVPELLGKNQYDLIISNLSMHWINDLPEVYKKLFNCLKPDGCFIGSMFGGDTLFELRTALQLAEIERYGGISPRISPFVESSDVGNLMQKAGFQMLTVDAEELIVDYPNMLALMEDLQLMGENNSVLMNPPPLTKDLLLAAEPIYRELHGNKVTGHLPATFRFVYMIGWKPGKYLAKPAPRGSADVSLKDAFEGTTTGTTTLVEDDSWAKKN